MAVQSRRRQPLREQARSVPAFRPTSSGPRRVLQIHHPKAVDLGPRQGAGWTAPTKASPSSSNSKSFVDEEAPIASATPSRAPARARAARARARASGPRAAGRAAGAGARARRRGAGAGAGAGGRRRTGRIVAEQLAPLFQHLVDEFVRVLLGLVVRVAHV